MFTANSSSATEPFFVNQHEFEQVLDIAIRSAPVYVDEAYSREGK
jgi:hypothetical protein